MYNTSKWSVNRTTVTLTSGGRLVIAKTHRTHGAAVEHVAMQNRVWQRAVDSYLSKNMTPPEQFTPAGRLVHMVWDGNVRPTMDAWGESISW